MSQERVLNLLFDKTFPSRPAAAQQNPLGVNSSMGRLLSAGGNDGDDMRQFNYYGNVGAPNIEEFTEADVAKLEREVEELLRNRVTSAGPDRGLVNIKGSDFRVTKSAHQAKRQNLMMSAAYGQRAGHIYEDYNEDEEDDTK